MKNPKEAHDGDTHLAVDLGGSSHLTPPDSDSDSSSPVAQLLTVSHSGYTDGDDKDALKNSKACLGELPAELLVNIFHYLDLESDQSSLACLSQTSKGVKRIADECLYSSIDLDNKRLGDLNTSNLLMYTIHTNPQLAMLVKRIKCTDRAVDLLRRLLQATPNLKELRFDGRSKRLQRSRVTNLFQNAAQTMIDGKPTEFAHLKKFSTGIPISLAELRWLFQFQSIEHLHCSLIPVTSTQSWDCLEPKSKVRNLALMMDYCTGRTLHGYYNSSVMAQIVSSIDSLKRLVFWGSNQPDISLTESLGPWAPFKQALALHKDTLEVLQVDSCLYRGTIGSLQDYTRVWALSIGLNSIIELPPNEGSLVAMLPTGLKDLALYIFPEDSAYSRQSAQAIGALRNSKYLQRVLLKAWGEQLWLSTVEEILRNAGIKVDLDVYCPR